MKDKPNSQIIQIEKDYVTCLAIVARYRIWHPEDADYVLLFHYYIW